MLRIPRIPKIVFIVVSIGIAFLVSSFLYSHYFDESSQFDTIALKNDVDAIVTSVTTFHFELPRVTLFSQRIENPSPTPEELYPTPVGNALPDIPTSTPYIQPMRGTTYPTVRPLSLVPTKQVTSAPQPTKGPDLFSIDAALKRPGETVDDIIAQAAAKACAPKEVLRTLASIESGGFLIRSPLNIFFSITRPTSGIASSSLKKNASVADMPMTVIPELSFRTANMPDTNVEKVRVVGLEW